MTGTIDRGAPQHSGSTAYINARIIDPVGDSEYRGAVLISDGKIADYGPNLFASGAPYGIESIDCRGHYLAPGIVDTRVHTGEPGEELVRVGFGEQRGDVWPFLHRQRLVVTGDGRVEQGLEDPELRGEEPVHRR